MQNQEKMPALPEKWKDWRLLEIIGEGSCGRVYRAKNRDGKVSAIKIMEIPADSYELQALTRLKGCPYIVEAEDSLIQETDKERWTLYLRMECLKSLEELLQERALTEEEALCMMTDLCRGLERCEQEGILHRDIKPGNILITADGRAKLGDFGIAGEQAKADDSHAIQGTFACMAPETFYGEKQDQRTDLYSLGMVFYQAINGGREPFVYGDKNTAGYGEREAALKKRMKGAELSLPKEASPEFGRILKKTCAFQPQKRYQNASQLLKALMRCQRNRKHRLFAWLGGLSGRKWASLAVVLAMVACIGSWLAWRQTPLLEYRDQEGKWIYCLKRNGTLILGGEEAALALKAAPGWSTVRNQVSRLVVQGDVRELKVNGLEMRYLEQIELPEGLEKIGDESFQRCEKLREITFPSTLREIGKRTFSLCRSLESAVFPEGMETIGYAAFSECASLVQVDVPASVTEIGHDAFADTPWLEEQVASGDDLVINGILLVYSGGTDMNITEDMGIHSISKQVCYGDVQLRSVTMEDTVEKIGENAFELCTSLLSVTLPQNLKELPENVFSCCTALEEVVIPEGLERIGACAFYGDRSLQNLVIPDTVVSVGEKAFEGTAWYNDLLEGKDYAVWNGILLECLVDDL